jgi:hypothetical protein
LIREALLAYLDRTPAPPPSAFAFGSDLFGRFSGPVDLAARRKPALAEDWGRKHPKSG